MTKDPHRSNNLPLSAYDTDPGVRARAARTVLRNARDVTDASHLLDVLGLITADLPTPTRENP
jgi:hypothetical protein